MPEYKEPKDNATVMSEPKHTLEPWRVGSGYRSAGYRRKYPLGLTYQFPCRLSMSVK